MFYRSQVEVAAALCEIIDCYWNNEMKEKYMIESIKKILCNNKEKIIKEGKYTTIVRQKCGKRRLEIIEKIIQLSNCI